MTDLAAYGYAAVVAIGGIIGYLKAGSVASLSAGLLFGGAAAFGAMQTSRNPGNFFVILVTSWVMSMAYGLCTYVKRMTYSYYPRQGQPLHLGTSLALSCLMGYRYTNSGKFMPAGLVASLSLVMVVRYGYRMYSG